MSPSDPLQLVGPDGRPIGKPAGVLINPITGKPDAPAEKKAPWWKRLRPAPAARSQITHAPRGSAPRAWRRAEAMTARTRDDGRPTRKARKAATRILRTAARYGIKPQ